MEKMDTAQNRRDFIKKGVTGIAGAAFIPSLIEKNKITKSMQQKKIITRTLGKTGIKLPVLSMGGGTCWDKSIYEAGLESGIKHIDTSELYQSGNHEKLVGEIMKGRKRESVIIATSYYFRLGRGEHNTPEIINKAKSFDLSKAIDSSLLRLGLDYVDIFYAAGIKSREVALNEEIVSNLQKLKKEGKTRFIGMATHSNEHVVLRAAADGNIHDVVMAQYNHIQPHKEEVKNAIAYAAKAGIGIVAMKTFAGGRGIKNFEAALKWVLQDKNVCTAVPTMKNLDELNAHLPVLKSLEYTPEEKAAIEGSGGASAQNVFCSYCEKCVPQCPYNVDIPSLMRSYMYAYGHKNMWLAKENIKSIDLSNIECNSCTDCSVECTMGFDVQDKVKNMQWINNVPDEFLA